MNAQISPGDLARPHAFLEGMTKCVKCHEIGTGPSAANCLACHREIDARLKDKKGLHHVEVSLRKKACFSCHSEHAGRKFQMVHWENGRDQFNHGLTGYNLKGRHAAILCRDCHKPTFIKVDLQQLQPKINLKQTFLGLDKSCLSCHEDEHRKQLGQDCLRCHTEKAWKPPEKFDHSRTRFRLTGKHAKVDCARCHPQVRDRRRQRGKLKPRYTKFVGLDFRSCNGCHKDVHKGKFGADCQSCHTTAGWLKMDRATFDHSKTRFPLLGKHKYVDCKLCHKTGDMMKPLRFSACTACHADVHKGKLGRDCTRCHSERGWKRFNKKAFDHRATGFALKGAHKQVKCVKCHKTGKMTVALKSDFCSDCHTDVHGGQFASRAGNGRCESCHNERGFLPSLFGQAEHQKTDFPLQGSHMATPCVACHKMAATRSGKRLRRFVFASALCRDCHEDPHAAQFSRIQPKKTCDTCHHPDEWSQLDFSHDRDSRFKLEGSHKRVSCDGCHKRVKFKNQIFILYRPIDPSCETCHSRGGMKLKKQPR